MYFLQRSASDRRDTVRLALMDLTHRARHAPDGAPSPSCAFMLAPGLSCLMNYTRKRQALTITVQDAKGRSAVSVDSSLHLASREYLGVLHRITSEIEALSVHFTPCA